MQPPEDVKVDLAEELYGDSLRLSKPESSSGLATNNYNLENLDGSLNGSWDEEQSEIRELDREWERRREQFHTAGYRDGIIAGKEAISQQGFNIGFKESVLAGYKFGIVRGVSSALAFLSDEVRQKLCDEEETREKFHKLQNSVNVLSTEDAIKVFYGAMVTKQGEEKSGEEGSRSSGSGVVTDLGSYVSELSSLLDKSPKIEVRLDTDRKLV